MKRAGTARWSLAIAEGWESRNDPECLTFVRPDDIGALQISGALKDAGSVTDDDLAWMIEENPPAAASRPCTVGAFVGVSQGYADGGRWWRRWFLRNGNLALFVTYNCTAQDAGVEDVDVDRMLSTLRIEPSDA